MRTALLALALVLASQSVRAATAYEALRVLGKQRGESILDNVTEVRGTKGAPQPREWKIIVKDASRGGIKEFDVQGTRLLGEKSPLFRTTGSPMNMSELNLDSDGVYQVAEREAKKAGFPYDHADYALRAGAHGGVPVWEVRLVDNKSGDVATINVGAARGNIISEEGFVKRRGSTTAAPPPPERRPDEAGRPPEPVQQSPSPGLQGAGDGLNRFAGRVGRHFERRGRQIGDTFHNLFSKDKRDTAGPHGSSPKYDAKPEGSETNDTNSGKPRARD